MRQNLYPERLQLSLDTFIQRMHLLNRADNPQLVSKIAIKWTQGQPLLTKKLLQHILNSEEKIEEGEEAIAVEKIIRNRLLREFKQDELTLAIRKALYQKDFKQILEAGDGIISQNERIYLIELQKKLGLTTQQCQSIVSSFLILDRHLFFDSKNQIGADRENNSQLFFNNHNQNTLSSSALTKANYQQNSNQRLSISQNKRLIKGKSSAKKWLWLLLCILPVLLTIRGWDRLKSSTLAISNNARSSLEQQKFCVDLTSLQSPRMSLGEQLLTREYSHLKPASIMSFYEGIAAFARCEFPLAQTKFKQALAQDKNNPEALIYYNNAQAIAQPHFKIAVSIPLGSKRNIAWEILRGVAQAQTEINQQGGIQNKLLLVQVVNDDNDPNIARQVAKQLAADKNIIAVVGHNNSNSSLAAAQIYQQQKLVMISPTSISTKLSGRGSYILRTVHSASALADKLANYASVNSLNKIAICSDSADSASSTFAKEFIKHTRDNNGNIETIDCDFANNDFRPDLAVTQAIAQNADSILLSASINKLDRAIAVAQANQQRLTLLGSPTLYTSKTIELGQEAVVGMVLPSPWLSVINNDFSQTAKQYWGGKVNWRTAMAYDAVKAIAQGLQQSHTRSELQSTLTQPGFVVSGATGDFYFERGDRFGSVQLAYVKELPGKSNRYQFSELEPEDKLSVD